MRKIRENNDFTHIWAVERDGAPVDLTGLPKRLYLIHPREVKEITNFKTDGNLISVDFTKALLNNLGIYALELHYAIPDLSYPSGVRNCAVDTKFCKIVATTEESDDISEFTTTSDMAFGFDGDDAIKVWQRHNPNKTEDDYFTWVRLPATLAAAAVLDKVGELNNLMGTVEDNEDERKNAETLRKQKESDREISETERKDGETARKSTETERSEAENERKTSETDRKNAELDRENAEGLRDTAEVDRKAAEIDRKAAELARETAETLRQANTAASNADAARLAIAADLALKASQADLVQLESIH